MKPSLSVFASLLLAMASSCSSGSSAKGGDASIANDVGQTNDIGQTSDVGQARDVAPEVPADAVLVPPANVMFPEAPEVACSGEAAECPFPPSACADRSCDGAVCLGVTWVVYYDTPTCANNKCAYTKKYFECDVTSRCSAGGCRFNGTAAP